MDSMAHVLAEGDAVFLTVLGMGCVFLALVTLDLFMSFMDRIVDALALAVRLPPKVGARLLGRSGADAMGQVPGTGTTPPVAVSAEAGSSPEAGRSEEPIRDGVEKRIAAAISIALALHQGARAAALPVAARAPAGGASPWKIGGRLRQLQRHPRR